MEDNKLAVQVKPSNEIQLIARDLAQRLKYMIVNGSKLSDNEVYALAQYSAANGLNPFAGECYYLPGVGPCPGVAGWRSKAQDQLDFEANLFGKQGGNMWVECYHADKADCAFDPNTDIAYKVVLHDSVSRKRWTDSIKEIVTDYMAAGASFFDAHDKAKELIGPEPVTVSWGVVFGSENFGAKVEKFDRHERAKKRGEKLCLRKRFPRINLPESDKYDGLAEDDVTIIMEEPEKKPVTQSEREIVDSLFGKEEIIEGSIEPETTPETKTADQKVVRTNGWVNAHKLNGTIIGTIHKTSDLKKYEQYIQTDEEREAYEMRMVALREAEEK